MRRLVALLLILTACTARQVAPKDPPPSRSPSPSPSVSLAGGIPSQAQVQKLADEALAGLLDPAKRQVAVDALAYLKASFYNCKAGATYNGQAPFTSRQDAVRVAKETAAAAKATVWAVATKRIPASAWGRTGTGWVGVLVVVVCGGVVLPNGGGK